MESILFIFYYFNEGYASGIQNKRLSEAVLSAAHNNIKYKIICRYSDNNTLDYTERVVVPNTLLNRLLLKILPKANAITLDEIYWTLKVIWKLRNISRNFDYIHIASSPYFIQLIGYILKWKNQIKWIAQLLDPISDNTYFNSYKPNLIILSKIEKLVTQKADLVLLNNTRMLTKLKSRYPKKEFKLKVLPQITCKIKYEKKITNMKITLYHAGNLYGLRSIDFVINSLNILKHKTEAFDLLELHFIGNYPEIEKNKIYKHGLHNTVFFRKPIPSSELYLLLSKADGLIMIDSLISEGIFFPSKLCEYFSFQKIIFAITPKESVTSDLLYRSGHFCFDIGKEELFANALAEIIKNPACYENTFKKDLYLDYLPELIAEKYIKMLIDLK